MTTTVKYMETPTKPLRCDVCQRNIDRNEYSSYWIITIDGVAKNVHSDNCFSHLVQPTCPKCNSTHVMLVGFNEKFESYECEPCFIWFKHGIRAGVVFNERGGHLVMNDLHPDMDH